MTLIAFFALGHAGLRIRHVSINGGGRQVAQVQRAHLGENRARFLAQLDTLVRVLLGMGQVLQQVGFRQQHRPGCPPRGDDGAQQLDPRLDAHAAKRRR